MHGGKLSCCGQPAALCPFPQSRFLAGPGADPKPPGVLPPCSSHQPAVLLPPCNQVPCLLLLTCLGDFTHPARRLINLLRKQRKGRGEEGVQPGVKCLGSWGWASPGSPQSIPAHTGGVQAAHPHQGLRGVLGHPWALGTASTSSMEQAKDPAEGLTDSLLWHLQL